MSSGPHSNPTFETRERLLQAVDALVRSAHVEIMRVYDRPIEARLKEDQSPLTDADLASHRALVAGLADLTPGTPVISEEGGLPDVSVRREWAAYWLIDPLDGTKEFLARNGEFTVNVALIEASRPTLGVVGVPARDETFVGDVRRALAQRWSGGRQYELKTRRYAGGSSTIVASRRHGGDALERALAQIQTEVGPVECRSVGSALKLCLLAEGEADVYPRLAPTSEWDTAAGQAVLEAAGGAVLRLTGEPVVYNKADILNPSFVAVGDVTFDWLRYFAR